ncbi:unnamed protein product [Oikopleura dioica]|uniref:Uncharacterized protein n=1 Tax=Oikopleura dioica TaxID=34765 RepID=E4XN90_OIKDI|nr:unnamed protein product [Oikopleura dioica]
MAENSGLKKSLASAKKRICELKEKTSTMSSPITLFYGDKTGMQSYAIRKDGAKSDVDFKISGLSIDPNEFPFRYSISVVLVGQVYIFGGTPSTRNRISIVDGCDIVTLRQKLVQDVSKASSVVVLTDENAGDINL